MVYERMRGEAMLVKVLVGLMVAFAGFSTRAECAELSGISLQSDVVYGHKDGLAMTYDIFAPKVQANGRGVVFMVSGGWVSRWAPPEQMVGLFQPLLDAGYTVIAVRHGSSPKYLIPEITSDVRSALQHISDHAGDYAIDPARLGVFGFSAGGHLSLMLGTTTNQTQEGAGAGAQPRVAAVVAIFPPTDLAPYTALGNPLREQFPALKFDIDQTELYSPLKQVSPDDAPTLLVHGDKDELVPLWHSEKIHAAFGQANVASRLIVIEGAGHGFDADGNKRMFEGMVDWFNTHLK